MADYTTLAAVQAQMGVSLSATQQATAAGLIPAVTAYINRFTGRDWTQAVVTDEHHLLSGANSLLGARGDPFQWLRGEDLLLDSPFFSVQTVNDQPGAAGTALQFTIVDPSEGWIRVVAGWYGRDCYVSYMPSAAVPADIQTAAAMIAAHWLRQPVHPERVGLQRLMIADRNFDLQMLPPSELPPEALGILRNQRRWVLA